MQCTLDIDSFSPELIRGTDTYGVPIVHLRPSVFYKKTGCKLHSAAVPNQEHGSFQSPPEARRVRWARARGRFHFRFENRDCYSATIEQALTLGITQ